MKIQTRIILIISILTILTFFSGCNQKSIMKNFEEESVRADAENIMNALEENNSDYIYDEYLSYMEKDEIDKGMEDIIRIYKGKRISMDLYGVNECKICKR